MRSLTVLLAAATAVAVAAAYVATAVAGTPPPQLVQSYSVLSLAALSFGGAVALLFYVAWMMVHGVPDPAARVKTALSACLAPAFLARRIAPLVLTFAFLGAFTVLKLLIPVVHPFAWDSAFGAADAALFGTEPWRLTHAVIGPLGTRLIDLAYGAWLPAFALAIFWFSVFAAPVIQRRFFIAFYAVWAAFGIGLATLLSSAGPCFLGLIDHPDAVRYSGLFPLRDAPGAAFAQAYIARAYRAGSSGIAEGISAMPSIHVAVAWLYVMAARHYGRLAFAALFGFYLLILVGSVLLGWHYAVDGLVGTAGAALCWRVARASPRGAAPTCPAG
jgi:hypothetical protein